ncbi:M24 family metallopeptidase [Thermodesulfobacteriota bacterium]
MDPILKEKVMKPISDEELERRWAAVREVMKDKKVDFLLIENNNDYLGGYIKWFTDVPAVHAYPISAIFPVDDEMTTFSHGEYEPKGGTGLPAWLVRGVKKRMSSPIMTSLNYTCRYDAEMIVNELKDFPNCTISFVNEGAMRAGFVNHIRQHMTGAKFVDITDEIDLIKAIKSPEEIEHIKDSCYVHDEAMKACFDAIKPGIREFEIGAIGRFRAKMLGSEQLFILIGSAPPGENFPYGNIHAMNRVIQEGDSLGILIEAVSPAGYYTHLHRTVCVGTIPDQLAGIYADMMTAYLRTRDLLKHGVDPLFILDDYNDFLKSKGYPEEKRLYAHGQGYDLVERPSCQIGETMKIEENMNIAIHPPIQKNGTANICDNYIITQTGVSECLHKTPQEIYVVK